MSEIPERSEIVIALMCDEIPAGQKISYTDRVQLVRQDRDRPLYSIYIDSEFETAIVVDEIKASHRFRQFLDDLHTRGETAETAEDADFTGWH
jgi:hypothetical protein